MYRFENIRKVFNGHLVAVDDVSLKIARGQQVAIIGPSGAGKTTLFRLLNLTLRPDGGALWLGDLDVGELRGRALRAMRRRIGTIYQQHNLVPRLPVVHNVLAGRLGAWSEWRAMWSLLRPQELDAAYAALSQVGIPEKLYARTDELSGGQQQRVAIARVLLQNPEVILADEPVASVDPNLAHSIVKLLVEISRESSKTLVMNLHSVELALTYFPRVIGFREGHIQFDRPPVELTEDLLSKLYAGVSRSEAQESGMDPDHESPFTSSCGSLLPGR
ncbi:MAG: phosphonate ABC transporter ATP-binding protein [Candidatus Methylomirabilales bacterium]